MPTRYVAFTRRTEDPKLSWLQRRLDESGIESRINGSSFHAPILEVDEGRIDDAWRILTPEIDDMPDDHEMFSQT